MKASLDMQDYSKILSLFELLGSLEVKLSLPRILISLYLLEFKRLQFGIFLF